MEFYFYTPPHPKKNKQKNPIHTEPNPALSSQGKLFYPKNPSSQIPLHLPSLPPLFSLALPPCLLLLLFSLFSSYLPSSFVSFLFPCHPSLPSWYGLLVKYLGGKLGAGRPKEDQQRKGCSCCGLAACFIIIPLPACLGFGAHRASCGVRIHNFLKNV